MRLNHYRLCDSLQLPPGPRAVDQINEELHALLTHYGFVREGRFGRRYVRRKPDGELIPGVAHHLLWEWDLEWHSGSVWLAPLPRQRYLSSDTPLAPHLLPRVPGSDSEGAHALNLSDGRRHRVRLGAGGLERRTRGDWVPCDPGPVRLSFSMRDLREMDGSQAGQRVARLWFEELHARVMASPFVQVLAAPLVCHDAAAGATGRVTGRHLRFGGGVGSHPRDVLRLRALKAPRQSWCVVPVVPEKGTPDHDRTLRAARGHLIPRVWLERSARGNDALKAVDAGATHPCSMHDGWLRMGVERLRAGMPVLYSPATGGLETDARNEWERQVREARAAGDRVLALALLPESVRHPARERLRTALAGADHLKFVRLETLQGKPAAARNVAVGLAALAGATICRLHGLPATDARTVFVGVDLGHDHRKRRSVIGLSLVNHRGEEKESVRLEVAANNERLPERVIRERIPALVRAWYPNPSRVVIHRDGRYLAGEEADFRQALAQFAEHTLVSVKKHPCTRAQAPDLAGRFFRVSDAEAVLVTTAQAASTSMPCPLGVELNHAGGLTLEDVVRQLFWLSMTYGGSVLHTPRVPLTISVANDVARTGRRRPRRVQRSAAAPRSPRAPAG